ncbi:MAG: hypothetical protein AAGI07_03285 [Bacteroidota bacterium]
MSKSSPTILRNAKNKGAVFSFSTFLKQIVHLIPFFAGFIISRFYSLSFKNDIFLIGMLLTAVMLFAARNKYPEPPYKNKS